MSVLILKGLLISLPLLVQAQEPPFKSTTTKIELSQRPLEGNKRWIPFVPKDKISPKFAERIAAQAKAQERAREMQKASEARELARKRRLAAEERQAADALAKRKAENEKLAQTLRPQCNEYVRERWEGKYILYDQGRYKWSITNIKQLEHRYTINLMIRFTNLVGQTEKYNGALTVEETNGGYQVVEKSPWCFWMNGQQFCK